MGDSTVLMKLAMDGGDLSVVALARHLGNMPHAALASRCKRMAREGLVETYRPADGARLHVRITQQGRDRAAEGKPA